jgi:hypothetical protein
MRLELKNLQEAHDDGFEFPMYLIHCNGDRFWTTEHTSHTGRLEILALAEIRAMMTKRAVKRADGRVEQVCVHGVGHTISSPRRGKHEFVHGCDGCCQELKA